MIVDAERIAIPAFRPGDIYEAWVYAFRERVKRFHPHDEFPPILTWNQLSAYETLTYSLMADFLNRQFEGMILELARFILTEGEKRD